MHAEGARCVFTCEIDKFARKTYEANFKSISPELFSSGNFAEDITKVDTATIPEFDILCAGFPCQAFSIAGLQKGFGDSRGQLFFEIIRILKAKKPKAFLLENVRNLLTHDGGRTFGVMLKALEEAGYTVHYKIVKACDFGLPQYRPRLFIVGFRAKVDFEFPKPVPLKVSMSDVFKANCNKEIGFTILARGRGGNIKRARNWDGYIVNGEVRRLAVAEAKQMMGFPENFLFPVSDTQAMKQLGNAIAVPVVEVITSHIFFCLKNRFNKSFFD